MAALQDERPDDEIWLLRTRHAALKLLCAACGDIGSGEYDAKAAAAACAAAMRTHPGDEKLQRHAAQACVQLRAGVLSCVESFSLAEAVRQGAG